LADGRQQEVHFDKITYRIKKLCYGLNMEFVDPVCEVVIGYRIGPLINTNTICAFVIYLLFEERL